jgi:hypothetical protein
VKREEKKQLEVRERETGIGEYSGHKIGGKGWG